MENSLDLQDSITSASTQLRGLGMLLDATDGDLGEYQIAALAISLISMADKLDADLAKAQDRKPVAA